MRWIAVLLVLVFLCGCAETRVVETAPEPAELGCSSPFIESDGECCLDENQNNFCDDAEEAEPAEADKEPETVDAEPVLAEDAGRAEENKQLLRELLEKKGVAEEKEYILESVSSNNFLELFSDDAAIVFDTSKTTGKTVAGVTKLQLYLGNQNMQYDYSPGTSDLDDISSNLIIVGNGCNNELIKSVFKLDDCGFEKGTGVLKLREYEGYHVLFIMAQDEDDIYALFNKIVKDEISYSGSEVEVEVAVE